MCPVRSLRYAGVGGEHRARAERQKGCAAGHHGAVCWGKNMAEALLAAEILEKAAQIAVICAGTGNKVYELSCEDVDVMHDFYEKHYSKRQQGEE